MKVYLVVRKITWPGTETGVAMILSAWQHESDARALAGHEQIGMDGHPALHLLGVQVSHIVETVKVNPGPWPKKEES